MSSNQTAASVAGLELETLSEELGASKSVPHWRGDVRNLDARAAVLWGQVMTAVQLSGYNLVKPPGARGASADWVREGYRMPRYHKLWRCVNALQ